MLTVKLIVFGLIFWMWSIWCGRNFNWDKNFPYIETKWDLWSFLQWNKIDLNSWWSIYKWFFFFFLSFFFFMISNEQRVLTYLHFASRGEIKKGKWLVKLIFFNTNHIYSLNAFVMRFQKWLVCWLSTNWSHWL